MTPRVGCAGWSIRADQADEFEQGSSHLARYASRFNAVEINSSFYRPHRQSTYTRWASTVPGDFRFSVKVPKHVTHECRLVNAEQALDKFASEVSGLGEKLGMLLVQLPPSLPCRLPQVRSFFRFLRRLVAAPIACEARHRVGSPRKSKRPSGKSRWCASSPIRRLWPTLAHRHS